MEEKYISANKLKEHYSWWGDTEQRQIFDTIVDLQPAADVAEVRHGRWRIITEIKGNETKEKVVCNRCFNSAHRDFRGFIISDYCPNCGAKMDGKTE